MKKYYGNYLGVVITGGEHDPEGRGRCQVFIPHIMPALYDGWNKDAENIEFNIVGDGLPTGLSPNIVERLKNMLPWAECAAPIVGASPCVKNGSSTLRNTNYYNGYTQDSFPLLDNIGVNAFGPIPSAEQASAISKQRTEQEGVWRSAQCGRDVREILNGVYGYNLTSSANGADYAPFLTNELKWEQITTNPDLAPPGSIMVWGRAGSSDKYGHVEYVALSDNGQKNYVGGSSTPSENYGGSNPERPFLGAFVPPSDSENLDTAVKKAEATNVNFTAHSTRELAQGVEGRNQNSDPTLDSNANINQYAKDLRSPLAQELDSNPALEEKLIRMAQAEVGSQGPQAQQAFIETVFNRAVATGQSLNSILDTSGGSSSGYYRQNFQTVNGSTRWDTAQQELTRGGSMLKDDYKIAISNVILGSNITGGATDNASSSFANNILTGSAQPGELNTNAANSTINGELFYTKNRFSEGSLAPLIEAGPTGASIARNTATIQNPATPEEFTSIGPPTNNQALGMFGYASEGTAVWCFFREGDPMFPVYFAASYGYAEWQNMYQHSSEGIGAGKGGAIPGTERMCANYYGGGFDSAQVTEESGLEPDTTFRVFGKTGSQLLFTKDHVEFTSTNNMRHHVFGDHYDLTEANKESRVRGNKNTYVEQDVFITIGNWSDEAIAASDEIQQYINEAMEIKSKTT